MTTSEAQGGASAKSAEAPAKEEKIYTLAQIAEHTSNTSLWICINGGVYDITAYLNDHPGGSEIMLIHGGKVSTAAWVVFAEYVCLFDYVGKYWPPTPYSLLSFYRFLDVGHSSSAKKTLEKHRIGVLNADEAAATALLESASASGSGMGMYVAAAIALAAALYYQFVYVPGSKMNNGA